ncbi:MAG: serine hydrolase domain-containing protein [Mycobacterium sp.]
MTARLPWRALAFVSAVTLSIVGCSDERAASSASTSASPGTAAPATTTTAPARDLDAAVAERLDAAITETMTAVKVPGAIVGLWGPDGQYVRAFGVADKATGAPMQVDFYHRIGSVTKTFTVTAVLQLVDQGKAKLDDPIATYVDGVPNGQEITLRQLARMQSGLPNYSDTESFARELYADPHRAFTPREVLDIAFAEPAVFAPGEGFQYCNSNTVLLGLVVEKLSGQPLSAYVSDHILAPLKLTNTAFPDDNAFPEPHAQGYTQGEDGREVVATDWNPSWGWAAGAMTSNLEDMRTWAEALAGGRLLSPETQKQRLETVGAPGLPPQDGYGVGLFDLGGWVGHNGSLPGYQTVVVHLAERQMTLVLMTNTDIPANGGEPSTALATAITKIVTPDHVYVLGG